MALAKCRACRKDVSTEATTCPHCGVPNPIAPISLTAALRSPASTPFSKPSAPPSSAPRRIEPAPRPVVAKPRPRFTAAHGLIVFGALAVVGLVWYGVATRSRNPTPQAAPSPMAPVGETPKDLGPLGWQWCRSSLGESNSAPSDLPPTPMDMVRVVKYGPLEVEWYWCRAQFKYSLAVLRADLKNNGAKPIGDLFIEFNFYDEDGAQIGDHLVTVRNLGAQPSRSSASRRPSMNSARELKSPRASVSSHGTYRP
jgi:hypothetical protein